MSMNKTVLSLLAAMSASVVVAQNSVNYTVQPVSTYPAEGACIESLDRVVMDLGRGVGPGGVKDL